MTKRIVRRDVLVGVAACAGALSFPASSAASDQARTHNITVKSFEFVPTLVEVKIGDTLRWTNEDIAPHTATSNSGNWDSGEIKRGESRSIIVTKDMETSYFCAYHPHMKAEIKIS